MLKKGTFIEIEYTGKIKDSNKVFDTTSEITAKKENIYNPNINYKPIILCIGEKQILVGIDEQLENKEVGNYILTIPIEKAFGKKNPKLLQLVSSSSFKKENIQPYPGLQVNIDNMMGIIKTVTPGRIIIDFNHPLSGHILIYNIKINKIITEQKQQLDSLISYYTTNFSTEIKEQKATIKVKLPNKIKTHLQETIPKLINSIKEVTIKEE